ncbi:hypothetical protein K8353_13025 [Burkholderia contaminans]|nr:hypothetical protein [Burkholderia contaminans]
MNLEPNCLRLFFKLNRNASDFGAAGQPGKPAAQYKDGRDGRHETPVYAPFRMR